MHDNSPRSSIEDSLDTEEMASISPPPAHSVSSRGDDEVVSKKAFLGRGEVPEIIGVTPQDDPSDAGHMGEKAPMGTGDGARIPFGPQPDTIPETYTAPGSSERHSPPGGGVPVPPVTSVQPEAPDNLLEALRGASIVDEHRVLMDTVIEKVQFVKSGLTKACTSLLTGFEVSNVIVGKISQYRQ